MLKEIGYFMNKVTSMKSIHILPDAKLLLKNARRLAPKISSCVHLSLLRISVPWIVRFLVPPFILIRFFF